VICSKLNITLKRHLMRDKALLGILLLNRGKTITLRKARLFRRTLRRRVRLWEHLRLSTSQIIITIKGHLRLRGPPYNDDRRRHHYMSQ
jgi:hypothetical protein